MGPPFAARLRGHVRASAIPPGLNTDTPPGVAAEHAILRGPRPHIAPTGLDSLALVPGSSTLTPAFAPFSQWPPHSPPCRRLPSPSAPRAGSPAGPRPCSGTRARARAPSARSPWPTKTARACSRPARLPPGGSRSPTGFPPRVLPSGAAADGSRPSLPTPGSTSSAPATSTTSQPSNEGQALPQRRHRPRCRHRHTHHLRANTRHRRRVRLRRFHRLRRRSVQACPLRLLLRRGPRPPHHGYLHWQLPLNGPRGG